VVSVKDYNAPLTVRYTFPNRKFSYLDKKVQGKTGQVGELSGSVAKISPFTTSL